MFGFLRGNPKKKAAALAQKGKFGEAADLAEREGLHDLAIDYFLQAKKPHRAAQIAVQMGNARKAAEIYEGDGDMKRAAILYDQVGDKAKAAELRGVDPNALPTLAAPVAAPVAVAAPSAKPTADRGALGRSGRQPVGNPSRPAASGSGKQPAGAAGAAADSEGPPASAACLAVLAKVQDLASLPGTASRLVQTLDDPNVSPNQVAQEINLDQGVTTMVLRVANSAYYRASGQVRDVTEALVVVGFDLVRQMVLARLAKMVLRKNDELQKVLWRHSLATALAAQACARSVRGVTVSHAFTGGLLHDVGKSVMHEAFGPPYAEVWPRSIATGKPSDEIERELFGVDHTEVGGELLRLWKLPAFYQRIVRYHHEPRSTQLTDRDQKIACMVALGGAVAKFIGHGPVEGRPPKEMLDHPLLASLGTTRSVIDQMAVYVEKELAKFTELLA